MSSAHSQIMEERCQWSGKRVAIWGAGLSGVSAAHLLIKLGADVTLYDSKTLQELPHAQNLHQSVKTYFGQANQLHDAEILIPSPGLKPTHPLLQAALDSGVKVMSEIELGARVTQARIIAITGTDGKSTTTKLIAEGLKCQSLWVKAVGNIGDPICNWALEAPSDGFLVVEVSAFQLWSTHQLNAEAGVITNIAEDHLDYFDGSALAYRQAKLRLAYLLKPHHPLFYPQGYLALPELSKEIEHGDLDIDLLSYTLPQLPIESPLLGDHNQRNLQVALCLIKSLGFDEVLAKEQFKTFMPLPYRMTLSRHHQGVLYVNDSKATNVHAACTGLNSVRETLIVITGGYDKNLDLNPLLDCLQKKARAVFCIGQTGIKIHHALQALNCHSTYSGTLENAVSAAHQMAIPGEMVILSPAASSFDQFKNFEDRGETFDILVSSLTS